jgi:hypothetical protein
MSVTDLIPVQYRMLAVLFAAAVALAAAAAAGAVINGWRMDGGHQHAIAAEKASYALLLGQYNDLKLKVGTQNAAIDLMAEKTKAAGERRELAEKFAAEAIKGTTARQAAARNSPATNCDGVLREAWGQK